MHITVMGYTKFTMKFVEQNDIRIIVYKSENKFGVILGFDIFFFFLPHRNIAFASATIPAFATSA